MFNATVRRRISIGTALTMVFVASVVISAPDDLPRPSNLPRDASTANANANAAQQTAASPAAAASATTTQAYAGTNQCFSCHRAQTDKWSDTKHTHAFSDIPKIYQNDVACLKCHVTGFGKSGGYVAAGEKDLLMVGCEACHGPGAMHVDAAKRFVLANPGEEAQAEKEMRETIVKTPTDKVCITCHIEQAHQKHPTYTGQLAASTRAKFTDQGSSASFTGCPLPTLGKPSSTRYTIKTCGGCQFDQYKQWGTAKHSDLAAILPAKYGADQACQTCHANIAEITIKKMVSDPHHHFIGLACETCHGPALEHIQFNKQFISAPPLGPRLEQAARDTIRQAKPATTCIQCHVRQTHKQHPEYERK